MMLLGCYSETVTLRDVVQITLFEERTPTLAAYGVVNRGLVVLNQP
jgi:hypothetical protein